MKCNYVLSLFVSFIAFNADRTHSMMIGGGGFFPGAMGGGGLMGPGLLGGGMAGGMAGGMIGGPLGGMGGGFGGGLMGGRLQMRPPWNNFPMQQQLMG
uniref:Glycine rich superfamily member n=1 Tax=Rhipicephalus appendiculatus TaxID=34631 RepID=A0A131YG29_RHIAP